MDCLNSISMAGCEKEVSLNDVREVLRKTTAYKIDSKWQIAPIKNKVGETECDDDKRGTRFHSRHVLLAEVDSLIFKNYSLKRTFPIGIPIVNSLASDA